MIAITMYLCMRVRSVIAIAYEILPKLHLMDASQEAGIVSLFLSLRSDVITSLATTWLKVTVV